MKNGKLGNGKPLSGYSDVAFSEALQKIINSKGIVKAAVTSERGADFANCWRKLGIDPKFGKEILKELELTWHHIDDLSENLIGSYQL